MMLLEIAPIIEAGTEGPLVTGHLTPRDTNGHQRSSEDRPSVTREGPDHLCLNEVYPDPDRDLNGDMVTDQMDEFIELYNPTAVTVNLSGVHWSPTTRTPMDWGRCSWGQGRYWPSSGERPVWSFPAMRQ
ncbi:MAG: lamin tail domain-containing protein [Desulfobacterales bacterium]|nr:lamin tail domain-containing protein [Desulfobacterales bacterium]